MNPSHLTQAELANRWRLKTRTLERWRLEGIGPVFLKLHNRVAYREEDIIAYEEQSLRKSTGEKINGDAT